MCDKDSDKKFFYKMNTREDVSYLLKISDKGLKYFLFTNKQKYKIFSISKKDGTERTITAPEKQLKFHQKKLANVLNRVYSPKICAYGFIPERNIINNASGHVNKRLVLNVDLENFFTQIHFGRVRGMFKNPPYSLGEQAATTLAQLVCHDGCLPQGSPCSPVISNMICTPLDNAFMRLAKECKCHYTRYADDITFSTNRKAFPKEVVFYNKGNLTLGSKFKQILNTHSFQENQKKLSLRTNKERQEVTGLTVNEFPNIRRSYVRELRSILHHCKTDGVFKTSKVYLEKYPNRKMKSNDIPEEKLVGWFQTVLKGKINYIRQIRGELSPSFLSNAKKYNEIFKENQFDLKYSSEFDKMISENVFILEFEHGNQFVQGTGFLCEDYGLFTNHHVIKDYLPLTVYQHTKYPECEGIVCAMFHTIWGDEVIDYALLKFESNAQKLKLGDSTKLKVGDMVTLVGFPNYSHTNDSTPTVQCCSIINFTHLHRGTLYSVSGKIGHGASGGVVLDSNNKVVGIIRAGAVTLDDDEPNTKTGFIPIHIVLDDIKKKEDG